MIKTVNVLLFLFGLYFYIILQVSSISSEYYIKALESLKLFSHILFVYQLKNWYFASHWSLAYK